VNPQSIILSIAQEHGVAPDAILSSQRNAEVVRARHGAMHALNEEGLRVVEIARALNTTTGAVSHCLNGKGENKKSVITEKLRKAGFPKRSLGKVDRMCGPGLDKAIELWSGFATDGLYLLIGRRGTGKTQIATYLARQWVLKGNVQGRYVKALDLFDAIKATWETRQSEESIMSGYRRTGFLVIDEVHDRGASDWEQRKLINLIDHRYDDMKATILIGNMTKAEAEQQLGPSIWSRMAECGGVINCDWGSYRG